MGTSPLTKKIVFNGTSVGQAIVNEPALTLGISLVDTTGALAAATTFGRFEINGQTQTLTAFDNPAAGAASCPRKVSFSGSVLITSTTTIPEDEF